MRGMPTIVIGSLDLLSMLVGHPRHLYREEKHVKARVSARDFCSGRNLTQNILNTDEQSLKSRKKQSTCEAVRGLPEWLKKLAA